MTTISRAAAATTSLLGGNGNDTLTGGGGLDYIDGGSGHRYRGLFGLDLRLRHLSLRPRHRRGAQWRRGADGADLLVWVEKLQFADVTIDLTTNNAPIAFNDSAALTEDAGSYSSGSASVLDNDFDFEGDALTGHRPACSPAPMARSRSMPTAPIIMC